MDLPYTELEHRLGPDGLGALVISVRPARGRRTLALEVARDRLLRACEVELDADARWRLNFDLYFARGEMRWPRRFGAPLERVAAELATCSPRDLALGIWTDGDGPVPRGAPRGMLIRVFPDRPAT